MAFRRIPALTGLDSPPSHFLLVSVLPRSCLFAGSFRIEAKGQRSVFFRHTSVLEERVVHKKGTRPSNSELVSTTVSVSHSTCILLII